MSIDAGMFLQNAEGQGYLVRHHQHGVAVFGEVPCEEFSKLAKLWEKQRGYDMFDLVISGHLGACFVVVSSESGNSWRKELGIDQPERLTRADGSPMDPHDWLRCGDTGISSKVIHSVMTNRTVNDEGIPRDPEDFGRCYRLLQRFPAWRQRLPEVATAYPAWSKLVENWDELERLYEEESPKKKCPKLFKRMRELQT